MKPEHKNLSPTELALITWYAPDHLLHKDPEHPTLKLAGEIGELLDLYAKDKFKPGFDWMNCECGMSMERHDEDGYTDVGLYCKWSAPLVFHELGDVWYYLRVLAWQSDVVFLLPDDWYAHDNLDCIKEMYRYAASILYADWDGVEPTLQEIYYYLNILLANLDFTLEELTELNYRKLNSEETNHGWRGT